MKKKIVILGSTGSIGKSLIKILQKHKKNYKIMLLVCNSNYRELLKQVVIFDVKNIVITDHKVFLLVKKKLSNKKINIFNTFDCFNKIFNKKIDYTMSAISGFDGLKPTIDIIKHTKIIALANKESIICGWSLISKNLKKYNTQLIPIVSQY